jgi:glycosyltransferase involved in cell wall biosynthesis
VILGDGNKKSKLENKIIELELSEFIKLPGIVGNLTDWYLRADLYVMSSQSEDFPDP